MKNGTLVVAGVVGIVVAIGGAGPLVFAKAEDSSVPYKIGVVDVDTAAEEYTFRRDQVAKLSTEFNTRSDRLQQEYGTLVDRRDQLRSDATTINEEARLMLRLEIEDDFHRLQQQLARLDADQSRALERLHELVSHDVRTAIEAIAYEEDYHLVLRINDGNPTDVVYASSTINMTPKLIDRLNADPRESR